MTLLPAIDLSRSAIFLDIDGTVLDIAPTPQDVVIPDGLIDDIATLRERCSGALAVVSGRTLEDIDRLFAPLKLAAAGAHGALVRSDPNAPIGHLQRPIPAALRAQFCSLADRTGMFIEDKEVTLALHYRLRKPPHLPQEAVTALGDAAIQAGFSLLHGKKVLELKPAGTDKGSALRSFMQKPPFVGRTPVFAGDDVTDGYAFAVLASLNGIGISVGQRFAGAAYCVDRPATLRAWLHSLTEEAGSSDLEPRSLTAVAGFERRET
jgi:trehalose 6-phosphate phosphatase